MKVAVITGASSGIGRAIAQRLAARGDHVVLAARRVDELERTLELCGGRGRAVQCDVSDRAQVAALARSVEEQEGACHLLVNNAGIGTRDGFHSAADIDQLHQVMGVNFFGAAYAIGELLPLIEQSAPATIVNVSSVAGLYGLPNAPIYCASKFALNGFGEGLQSLLHPRGIRVCTIQPGPLPTPGFPHTHLVGTLRGKLLMTDVEAIARMVDRMSRGKGAPTRVIPRLYRWGEFVRSGAPPVYRGILRRAGRAAAAREDRRRARAAAANADAPTRVTTSER